MRLLNEDDEDLIVNFEELVQAFASDPYNNLFLRKILLSNWYKVRDFWFQIELS